MHTHDYLLSKVFFFFSCYSRSLTYTTLGTLAKTLENTSIHQRSFLETQRTEHTPKWKLKLAKAGRRRLGSISR